VLLGVVTCYWVFSSGSMCY